MYIKLLGKKVFSYGKHLGGNASREPIDLLSVLLDLLGVEHALESAGLLRQLEQLLPLILGQQGLLGQGALGVLGLALGLPL